MVLLSRYLDSDEEDPTRLRIFMQYGHEGDLLQNRQKVLRWTDRQRLEVALQIAEALHYLHTRQPELVHLDIKP